MTGVIEENKEAKKSKKRLKFIDMARSIAILLMLEGHLVHDLLMPELRDPDNVIFAVWSYVRQFTASIFLTLTGLIFVYLMLKHDGSAFFKNIRVKKGLKRVVELFFWGYVLQWYGFHVLGCIATGIFTILLLYGLYKIIRIVPLWIYFFVAAILIFSGYLFLRELPKDMPWPENAWFHIQNAFHGPSHRAVFPISPWMGYTMIGAMLGTLIYTYPKHVQRIYFPLGFLAVGCSLFWGANEILGVVDTIVDYIAPSFKYRFIYINWIIERVGMVLNVLGVLMIIDHYFGQYMKSDALFLKIGQNTLTIYILHMILLYGSVIKIGLNDHWHHKLNGWEVTFAAAMFILFFVILIKYLDWIKAKLSFILDPIRKFFEKLFFIR